MMKNYLRIISIILATSFFGAVANISSADPASGFQNNMGPGMMGYGSGYGTGHGMMGGYGSGYGMGSGMMGLGNYRALNLSADQKSKITPIQKETRAKQWAAMGKMMDAQERLQELYDVDKQDADAINKQYKVIEDLRRQMVDTSVEAHNRINSILTKEQKEQLEKSREMGRGYGPMMRDW
jgi:Spy/CpxP family protein refolding chaperone